MTEQQAIGFIRDYEPEESPYDNISDAGHNARRCVSMAKKQFEMTEGTEHYMRCMYLVYRGNLWRADPLTTPLKRVSPL